MFDHNELQVILSLNPLPPNFSIHFLQTVPYTFSMVLTERICLTIKSFFSWPVIISFILMTSMFAFGGDADWRE